MAPEIGLADLGARIAEARARITGTQGSSATTTMRSAVSVKRRFDESYSAGDIDWLPRRAQLEIAPAEGTETSSEGGWRELVISLSSGPDEIYRYFPFAAYCYVDDALAAIAEFDSEWQTVRLQIAVPADRTCVLTIATELSDFRLQLGRTADQRQLALVLCGLEFGGPASQPKPGHALAARDDHFSQSRTSLAKELPRPIFVIGAYRSGTSILTWALGQHPNIWPLEETGWLHLLGLGALAGQQLSAAARRSFFDVYDVSPAEYIAHLGCSIDDLLKTTSLRHFDRTNLQRLSGKAETGFDRFDARFQLARSLFDTKRRWVDGTPENAENILLLRALFPMARFVCAYRHPFDVVASMVHFERAGGAPMSIDDASDMWMRKVHAWVLAARALGSSYVQVLSYDEMVSSPNRTLQATFDFLGEPRFPKAAETFGTRINSSGVNMEERDQIRKAVASSDKAQPLLRLYEEVVGFSAGTWTEDPAALTELAGRQNDIVNRIVAQVL